MHKTIVIGGVIGAYGAKFLAENNEVTLIEEHKNENQPVHCAGLISKSGFERLNINPDKFILNKVRGAKFFSQNTSFEIRTNETKAYVINRKMFDNELLNSAIDSSVQFINERATDINAGENWTVKTKNNEFKAKNLVMATGANYKLHKKLNLMIPKFLNALQYEIFAECENDMVELHLTKDFFAWIIPLSNYTRIGIAGYENVKEKLDNFIKNLKQHRKVGEILAKQAGLIPIYDLKLKTEYKFSDLNLRLSGDAAAHVKATTGGGVVMGCLAARHLADKNYENGWRKEIGNELYLHLMFRKFLNQKSNRYSDMLMLANKYKHIFYSADMDIASKLLKNLIVEFVRHPLIIIDIFKILF
ncbi:MAG: NAD(P)/FAD-dependent oxidoreductase [Candidatus Altarchaeum sp.]|nr:NAD(P)/FAD-dependent oxidoreductase [Candidatus Altarchaeum sp.]